MGFAVPCDNRRAPELSMLDDSPPGRRRRGRPPRAPNEELAVNVHVRLTTSQYDATSARASAERVTIPDWIRRVLREATRRPRDQ